MKEIDSQWGDEMARDSRGDDRRHDKAGEGSETAHQEDTHVKIVYEHEQEMLCYKDRKADRHY